MNLITSAWISLFLGQAFAQSPFTINKYQWEVLNPVNPESDVQSNPNLIGPNSDVIAIPAGDKMLHYNITSNSSTLYELPWNTELYEVFSPKGSSIAWAAGGPQNQTNEIQGAMYRFDFGAKVPKWEIVWLGVNVKYTIRDIHGTADNNIWAVIGSGERYRLTSGVLHFDGKTWRKYLDEEYKSALKVFVRSEKEIFVSIDEGVLLRTTTGTFATKNDYVQYTLPEGDGFFSGIYGGTKSTDPIYLISGSQLSTISDFTCRPSAPTPFICSVFGRLCGKRCLKNVASASGSISAIQADFVPGLAPGHFYAGGLFGYGAFWNGQTFEMDESIIPSNQGQSIYNGIMAKDNYIYGTTSGFFIARKRIY
jgi:hypothetical protein